MRYDLEKKDTVFNIRYGFRDSKSDLFYLTESRSDGNGSFTKSSIVTSEVLEEILKENVSVPALRFKKGSQSFYETVSNSLAAKKCDEAQVDRTGCPPVTKKVFTNRINPNALKSLIG